jgi:hypothetical protein
MTQRTALIAAAALVLTSVLPAGAQTTGAPKLVVAEQVLDFGTVTQGQTVNAEFKVRNEGDATLEVRAVRPTCGCTVADFDKEIPAGGTGTIRAKLDTTNFNGPISKSLLVITNDPEKPSMNLVLKAEVRPILEVLPRPLVRFNAIQLEQVTDKVTVVSDQPEPFTISKAVSAVPYITASVRKLGEGELVAGKQKSQYEVTLTLTDKAPVGPINTEVVLKTDNPKAKEVPIRVFGVVRALLHVTPSQLQFGSVEAASSPGRNVLIVNNREGEAVQITGVEINDPAFEAKAMTIEEGRRYQVTVTVKPDATPGTRDAMLTIHTTDPQFSTLQVPVRANLK